MPGNLLSSATPRHAAVLAQLSRIWTRVRTDFFWMVIVAFAVRVLVILAFHTYRIDGGIQSYDFGYEMGRIGRAIAQGKGFSNIYHSSTGPTSWEPPVYPYLVGGIFKVFGIYSHGSALVLLTINGFFSALTCVPIFLIARRCFGERVGIASAWTWALYPYAIYWCSTWIWETSLSTLLLATLFWLTLAMEEHEGFESWIQFGLLWGFTVLSNVSLTSFLPASGLWVVHSYAKRGKHWLGGAVVASLVFFACLTPWEIRNYRTFGHFIFVRGDFGEQLRLGNGPGARGTWMFDLIPSRNKAEFAKYASMGEVAYAAEQKQEAVQFIKSDMRRFLVLCGKKFLYYWGGNPRSPILQPKALENVFAIATAIVCFWGLIRSLRKRIPGAWLFFWLILLYPAVYYVTFPNPRYRLPIEPYIVMLGIFLITEAAKKKRMHPISPSGR
jgi:4-amino-4-deoxy-L-arabinose transferase-like glycosyltransferase